MPTYAKYEFPPDQMPEFFDEDGKCLVDGKVVILGHLTKDPAVLAEDGETVITPAVISDKIAVDILWSDKAEPAFPYQTYRILPKKHLHWVFNMEKYFDNKAL